MSRRSRLARLAATLTLTLLAPGAIPPATATPSLRTVVQDRPTPLERLREDAETRLRTHRDEQGRLAFVARRDGEAIDNPGTAGSTPVRVAARSHLERYGAALGVAEPQSWELADVEPLGEGSVVRFAQQVDGRPVLGGEVVVTLDQHRDATSLLADVGAEDQVPGGDLDADRAARTAVRVVARSNDLRPRALHATVVGKVVHDPALLPAPGALAPGEAWHLEVGNGTDVRELVLVDTVSGRVRLHFDQVADVLRRTVCDGANTVSIPKPCTTPVRQEGGSPSAVGDVEDAFILTGAAAAMYDDVAGVDLTELIGTGPKGSRVLPSTVRVCESAAECPMRNAFWNGSQMYYGDGFAVDDIIGHELTHGVIDRTSRLFYYHQSGAINESLADIFGELLDRRVSRPGEPPDEWLLGEESPLGALRDMADPIAQGQPDRMTSGAYDADLHLRDNGGVHANSGVGNKTFHLLAEGGTFNGRTVSALDQDPALPRAALLLFRTMTTLSSSSDYRDLADVLEQRCAELAAEGVAGFTGDHCASVTDAVAATELRLDPVHPSLTTAAEPDLTCPTGTTRATLLDSEAGTEGWTAGALWQRAPDASQGIGVNATSGTSSWFGWNPDPQGYGDQPSSSLRAPVVEVPERGETYLSFRHWRLFEWDPAGPWFYDGGFVSLAVDEGATSPPEVAALPWANGPDQEVLLQGPEPTRGFGGDSHGWVTSRVALGSFAGSSVGASFDVRGDSYGSLLGWYLDDIEVYSCVPPAEPPGEVAAFSTAPQGSGTTAKVRLSWQPPAEVGTGVTGYRVTRPDGSEVDLDAGARSYTVGGLGPGPSYDFEVRALGVDGTLGPTTARSVTALQVRTSTGKAERGRTSLTGRVVLAGTRTGVRTVVTVQQRLTARGAWRPLARQPRVDTRGRFVTSLTPRTTRWYRVVVAADPTHLAAVGAVHKVRSR